MAAPPQISLVASKRVPFDETIDDERGDYTGAAFAMHVRNEPGDTGDPLITLGDYAAGEGISATYEEIADPDDVSGETLIEVSRVRIRIAEATLEGEDVPLGADPSDDVVLYYDLHVTPSGGTKFVMCSGAFTIKPGVTI